MTNEARRRKGKGPIRSPPSRDELLRWCRRSGLQCRSMRDIFSFLARFFLFRCARRSRKIDDYPLDSRIICLNEVILRFKASCLALEFIFDSNVILYKLSEIAVHSVVLFISLILTVSLASLPSLVSSYF